MFMRLQDVFLDGFFGGIIHGNPPSALRPLEQGASAPDESIAPFGRLCSGALPSPGLCGLQPTRRPLGYTCTEL